MRMHKVSWSVPRVNSGGVPLINAQYNTVSAVRERQSRLTVVHSEEQGKREESVRRSRMGDLEGVFKSFCAFGGGKGEAPLMDNAKFAKFFRDLKLLDKALTSTDVDIIFSKCKE